MITRIHDATLAAGKFFGCTNAPEGPTARKDEADFRMIQNPPKSHDGYVPPARGGGAGAPATSSAPVADVDSEAPVQARSNLNHPHTGKVRIPRQLSRAKDASARLTLPFQA